MQQYQEGQRLQGSDGNVYVVRNGQPVPEQMQQPQQPQSIITKRADPYAAQIQQQQLIAAQARNATAPYDAQRAQADAARAQADALKAQRDLSAQQATANPQQQRRMANLANDEVLAAIADARNKVNAGFSTGYAARLGQVPVLGPLIEPQNSVDLGGALNTIASRLTLDKLGQLKQASPTGASGLGSLTEKEGALLRDSVAALGQTQSQDVLLNNLASVERHYRNVMALSNGQDPRNPRVQEQYGIVPLPKKKDDGASPSLTLTNDRTSSEQDPGLRGVNAAVRRQIGAGRPPAQIVAYLNSVKTGLGDEMSGDIAAATEFRAQNPRVPLNQYPISLETRQVPVSGFSGANSDLGAYALAAGDAVTAGNLNRFSGNPALARAAMTQIGQENSPASIAGTVTGGLAAGGILEAAIPGRALAGGLGAARQMLSDGIYGGAYGASTGQGDTATNGVMGAIEGIGGGMLGRGIMSGVGATARGITNPDVQYLAGRDIPMTIGQMARGSGRLGNKIAKREDRLMGYGGIGEDIADLRRGGVSAFNREAFRDGLEPIGRQNVAGVGEQGIEQMRSAVQGPGGAYDNALGGVNVGFDPQFQTEYGAARAALGNVERTGPEALSYLDARMQPFINTGTANGPRVQDMLQGLRDADFGTDAMGGLASEQVGNVRNALAANVERQAPGTIGGLRQADSAYRNLNILADAVKRGRNTDGLFAPSQLGDASVANATKFGNRITASTTDRPFFELQRSAQNVMPSKVPDSGTAGRAAAGRGMFGAVAGVLRDMTNAPFYAESAQPVIQSLLLNRPDIARRVGAGIQDRAQIGGMVASPLLLQYLSQRP